MSITPPPLKQGGCIGVFAPSSWVERKDIERSVKTMEGLGYKVFVHPQTYEREHQSAGSHLQKAMAFQGLWQRDDIHVIWAAGGGNRCLHLLDIINFEKLRGKPKALIGFSDVTALLNSVTEKTGITTYHGPVFKNLHKYRGLQKYRELDQLFDLLRGDQSKYPLKKENILHPGKAEGRLWGGNLSLFQYLTGDHIKDGIIFLEDCNEELSRIDRMLCHLRRCGVFQNARALVFGEFTQLQDSTKPFGYTIEDIIKEHTESLNIPILYNMPFGHGKNLYTFPIGQIAMIDTEKLSFTA